MTETEHHEAYRKSVIISVLLTCVGYAFFNIGDAAMKIVAAKFHFSEIFLFNSAIVFIFMAVYGWRTEGKKAFQTRKPKLMFMRALLAQIVGLCNIAAMPHIQLATFYTLVFTSPFWVVLLSALFMQDKLEKRRLAVILFGFLVIVAVFRPGSGMFNIWSALVLLGAFIYSGQMILVRHIGSSESRPFMMMCGAAMSLLIALPFLPAHYIAPTPYEWGLFLMLGLTGSIGLLCVSYAFQSAPSASIIAPYHYTQIIWGALLGYYLFNEVPGTPLMIGAVLIVIAGLYLIHSETRRPILKIRGV